MSVNEKKSEYLEKRKKILVEGKERNEKGEEI